MNLNIKDTIVLEDQKEYVVASKVLYKDIWYYYLVDLGKFSNLRYVTYDEELKRFLDVEDILLIRDLMPHFVLAAKDVIMELSMDEEQ